MRHSERLDPVARLTLAGGRLRFEAVVPDGTRAPLDEVRAYLNILIALPWPDARVTLPGGRSGEVVEVLRHAGRPLGPPCWGWRVAVLPDGATPDEVRVYDPHTIRIQRPKRSIEEGGGYHG